MTVSSDGSETIAVANYRQLLRPDGYTFQNRFVNNYLLYGTGSGWGYSGNFKDVSLYAVPLFREKVSGTAGR